MKNNIGLRIVLFALGVNGPRFVLTFLVADSIKPAPWIEATILTLTGIATGIVLTGGGAYIAHELIVMRNHFLARCFMVVCWVALLASTVIILAPLMAVALVRSELAQVLTTPQMRWQWSIVAVIAVEVLAAGAMVAHAVGGTETPTHAKRPGAWAQLSTAATNVAVAKLAQMAAQPQVATKPGAQPVTETPQPKPSATGAQRHNDLLRLLSDIEDPDAINKADLGRQLGVSRTQVGKDIDKLVGAGRLSINGKVEVLKL